ncbi:hypothetical protein [Streptomyces sp. NPDC093097]|uniref:hypothetical protein n=1 Tax=Streptomyces sp. NPDC093097 TaxID=3366027 RepID=UPI00380157BD
MSVTRRTLRAAAVAGLAIGFAVPVSSAVASSASSSVAPSSSASPTPGTSKSPGSDGAQDKTRGVQEYKLSNGAVVHVYRLPKGGYMAWITMNGQRIASLSAQNPTASVKGYKYELNQANGFVGVVHPGSWHSEQDKASPGGKSHQLDSKKGHKQSTGTGTGARHGQVPRGGVKAGAEGVPSSHQAGMLAAGGGMAGVGVAGLGLAMKRRARTDS